MTSVAIVCFTVFIIVLMFLASDVYLTLTERQRTRTQLEEARATMDAYVRESRTGMKMLEHHYSEMKTLATNTATADALLALSERVSIFEGALKQTVAQVVSATGYSEEKYKQLTAAAVRGQQAKK